MCPYPIEKTANTTIIAYGIQRAQFSGKFVEKGSPLICDPAEVVDLTGKSSPFFGLSSLTIRELVIGFGSFGGSIDRSSEPVSCFSYCTSYTARSHHGQ
jgi:hypothetical protein